MGPLSSPVLKWRIFQTNDRKASLTLDLLGLVAVVVLVLSNGFFVAAEFSLVSVRQTRIAELVEAWQRQGRNGAAAHSKTQTGSLPPHRAGYNPGQPGVRLDR